VEYVVSDFVDVSDATYFFFYADGTSIERVLTLYIIFVLPNLSLYANALSDLLFRVKRKAEISPHVEYS
jgi:hypothetical protein